MDIIDKIQKVLNEDFFSAGIFHNITPNGNLEITVDEELQKELQEMDDGEIQADTTLHDVFEPLLSNSELTWTNPEDIGALTDAPILSDVMIDDDEDVPEDAHFWYYDNYALRSPLEDLARDGKTVFQLTD
jgi:hypothetical protein